MPHYESGNTSIDEDEVEPAFVAEADHGEEEAEQMHAGGDSVDDDLEHADAPEYAEHTDEGEHADAEVEQSEATEYVEQSEATEYAEDEPEQPDPGQSAT